MGCITYTNRSKHSPPQLIDQRSLNLDELKRLGLIDEIREGDLGEKRVKMVGLGF